MNAGGGFFSTVAVLPGRTHRSTWQGCGRQTLVLSPPDTRHTCASLPPLYYYKPRRSECISHKSPGTRMPESLQGLSFREGLQEFRNSKCLYQFLLSSAVCDISTAPRPFQHFLLLLNFKFLPDRWEYCRISL